MVETVKVNPTTLSRDLAMPLEKVEATIALLESGLAAPFVMRYRQDQTGLNDVQSVARIAAAYEKQRKFADRKYSYLLNIEAQGALTPELHSLILDTRAPHRLDDLYMPFRARTQGAAQTARERGLDKLADAILTATDAATPVEELAANFVAQEKLTLAPDAALQGAIEIIADRYSENFDLRRNLRGLIQHGGVFVVTPIEKSVTVEQVQETSQPKTSEAVDATDATVVPISLTDEATNGGEALDANDEKSDARRAKKTAATSKEAVVQKYEVRFAARDVTLEIDALEASKYAAVTLDFNREEAVKIARQTLECDNKPYAATLLQCAEKAALELVVPALAQELRRELRDSAVEAELDDLQRALTNKLMRRPIVGRRVLAFDTGRYNQGKVAALDEFGNPLATETIHIKGSEERRKQEEKKLLDLVNRYNITVFALRATGRHMIAEPFVLKFIERYFADKDVAYIPVSDVGLDAYAASEESKREEPYYDMPERRAISLGRRALSPLEEFAKVEPELLCEEGALRRRVRTKILRDAVAKTISACVNSIGLDLNRATPQILRYVSGLTPMAAGNIVEYRKTNGRFKSREELRNVVGISDSTYAACAGFLKITQGTNPLDASWIHPEDYEIATKLLEKIGATCDDLRTEESRALVAAKFNECDLDALASEFEIGPKRLAFIVSELCEPGLDARDLLPPPIFKKKLLPLESFKPGMELLGSVAYVAPFGVFVDVGSSIAGLAHVSQISNRSVRDARTLCAVGDLVKVRVLDVDVDRARLSLAFVNPLSKNAREDRQPRRRNERQDDRRATRDENAREPRSEDGRRRPRREQTPAGGERAQRARRENSSGEGEERRPRRRERDEDRQPRNAHVLPKGKVVATLSEEKKSGKESLQSFEELMLFLEQRDQNEKKEG